MTSSIQNAPIQIESLHKVFGPQTVLDKIDLTVASGEVVALMGRSGTGKSVLLKLIVGLQSPDSGSIRIFDQDINRLSPSDLQETRKRIGFLFQQAALYDSLTVHENVAFPLKRHRQLPPSEAEDRVQELLKTVGMAEHANKLPSEISGGMQKRVGLARALALEPDLLLFDEPTAGLDPITSKEIDDLVLQLNAKRKVTSLVVTHDVHSAKAVSDRVVLIDKGNIVAEGKMEDLAKSHHPLVAPFLNGGS